MIVSVLIQEHQNEHGYVDASIGGVFLEEHAAEIGIARHPAARRAARGAARQCRGLMRTTVYVSAAARLESNRIPP